MGRPARTDGAPYRIRRTASTARADFEFNEGFTLRSIEIAILVFWGGVPEYQYLCTHTS